MKINSLKDVAACPLEAPRLYETDALRQATGDTLRPGGMALLREAMKQIDWPPGARVLDIGCGIGSTAAYLRRAHGLEAMGLDLSARLLEEGAARHPGIPLLRGRAEALPVADGVLAGLTCECVLSLTCDPAGALREFHRVLKPGGRLLLSDLYRRRNLEKDAHPGNCCLTGAFNREQLLGYLHGAGFNVQLWQDRSHLLAELAARLVLLHGSMTAFWAQFSAEGDGRSLQESVQAIRPGYFLVIADKG